MERWREMARDGERWRDGEMQTWRDREIEMEIEVEVEIETNSIEIGLCRDIRGKEIWT